MHGATVGNQLQGFVDPESPTRFLYTATKTGNMAEIRLGDTAVDVEGTFLIDGLPGIGLVAKIVSDYLIEQLEMKHYADVYGNDLPNIPVFHHETHELTTAVRIFVSPDHNIATLRSDVLISANAQDFIAALTDWIAENDMRPIYQIGLPLEFKGDTPRIFGVSTVNDDLLKAAGIEAPPLDGGVTGPSGAFLDHALECGVDATGLIVESDPFFPDPAAAQVMIEQGIEPITGLDVDTHPLHQSAGQIRKQKEELAKRVQDAMEERTNQAYPREIYR